MEDRIFDPPPPAFDRRLDPASTHPIAVAYSGGGDSLAALAATLAWARRAGRAVVAIHVDHRLQPASGDWARLAEANAARLGARFVGLSWAGDKPAHGVSAAARRARHALIAEAAREAGAKVVVLGHTADDRLEADLMRAEGSSLGWLYEWRPSPVWPEGRGVFLLRPLLGLRRAEIRERLASLGLAWIEDPANADPAFLRARVRARAGAEDLRPAPPAPDPADGLAALAAMARIDAHGALTLARGAFAEAQTEPARRFLSAALACVGGGEHPPRRERLIALAVRLAGPEAFTATLAGVKIIAADPILLARESGSYRRHGAPQTPLEPGQSVVWDGRFALTSHADVPGLVRPLAGLAKKLPQKQRDRLALAPAPVRAALPVWIAQDGEATCPLLAEDAPLTAALLVRKRLAGACGVISQEQGV